MHIYGSHICCVTTILVDTASTDDVKSAEPTTRIEVWLDDAQWWLTQDDGQLHMCDITFTNCRYDKFVTMYYTHACYASSMYVTIYCHIMIH